MVLQVTKYSIIFNTGGTLPLPFADDSPKFVKLITDILEPDLTYLKLADQFSRMNWETELGYDASKLLVQVATTGNYEFLADVKFTPKLLGNVVAFFGVTFWIVAKTWGLYAYTDDFLDKIPTLKDVKLEDLNIDETMAQQAVRNVIADAVRGANIAIQDETSETEAITDMGIVPDELLSKLTKEQADKLVEMAAILAEINSHDAYSVTTMSLGKLNRNEYLILPNSLRKVLTPYEDVGKPWATVRPDISIETFAQIYALNKASNMEVKDPIMFALIRAEAVKMGWVRDQREITWTPDVDDAMTTFIVDSDDITSKVEVARLAAFLVPLMSENVFRITGHHYLSGMSDEYDRKYQTLANAALCANITSILRPSELYHRVLHWVSPAVARRVLMAQLDSGTIPNAIGIRAHAAPAGTAIVTTTTAVIEAMKASQIADEITKYGGFDFDKVALAAAAVRANVVGFHQAYYAYDVRKATPNELAIFEEGKMEAIRFAPIAQGFIDAYHQNGALANARALRKYADNAPTLAKRALRVFKNLSKQDTESIAQLFQVAPEDTATKPTPVPVDGKTTVTQG